MKLGAMGPPASAVVGEQPRGGARSFGAALGRQQERVNRATRDRAGPSHERQAADVGAGGVIRLTEAVEAPQAELRDRLQAGLGPCDGAIALSSSAAERLAFLVQQTRGERPAVEVVLGGEVRVRLTQADQGIELSIQGGDRPLQALQASVPGILEALHGYGVRVTRVQVRGDVLGRGQKSSASRPALSR